MCNESRKMLRGFVWIFNSRLLFDNAFSETRVNNTMGGHEGSLLHTSVNVDSMCYLPDGQIRDYFFHRAALLGCHRHR